MRGALSIQGSHLIAGWGVSCCAPLGVLPPREMVSVAWGLRLLVDGYTGPVVRIRRNTDNVEQNFGCTTNGDLDTASIAAFLAGDSGFVSQVFDQGSSTLFGGSQTTRITQSGLTFQPLFDPVGMNGRPAMIFDGIDDRLDTGVNTGGIVNSTVIAVFQRGNISQVLGEVAALAPNDSGRGMFSSSGAAAFSFTDRIFVNGRELGAFMPTTPLIPTTGLPMVAVGDNGQPRNYTAGGNYRIGFGQPSNQFLGGPFSEVTFYKKLTPAQRAALQRNAADYYGVTLQ